MPLMTTTVEKTKKMGAPWCLSRLRIQGCQCCGSGLCYGASLNPGTSTCYGYGKNKERTNKQSFKKKKKDKTSKTWVGNSIYMVFYLILTTFALQIKRLRFRKKRVLFQIAQLINFRGGTRIRI